MSKFRSGVPRSGSAPLRRQRATPIERVRKESKSQEHVHDDSDSDGSGTSDSESMRVEQGGQSPLAKADLPEQSEDMPAQDELIDPSLLAMSAVEAMQGSMEDLDTTSMGIEHDVQDFVEEHPEPEQGEMDHSDLQSEGKKRKHEEDEDVHGFKRSKQDKEQQQMDEYTIAGNALGSSQTSESVEMEIDTSAFDSPSAITLASEANKDSLLAAQQATETEEEKRIRREEKRKRKEERRARKEAKRFEQAHFEGTPSGLGEEGSS